MTRTRYDGKRDLRAWIDPQLMKLIQHLAVDWEMNLTEAVEKILRLGLASVSARDKDQ